ncbi:L-arabinose transport system permease protein AraP [Cellulomonas hominis]|uniref:Arabinosaccharide transport system permease protein n=1 Tax=Cellulomonas hominis TaxID=156981 RepID=A0A511FFG4_9CELL|nr:sugar ABC transporter permease [Cellulomonas hominis]MBB5472796.1 arabinosaccharide transport system permease protein [Cellulomonas hominis]NKY06026.1 sugar ABC transporter permease [Cellulomonas hominis]NKY10050.1 sugar ABC transporter permease [Cellulomonas hominis]GEL46568.1 L-arabinose transport system permease protein AraP [Cellulomonas hominis]
MRPVVRLLYSQRLAPYLFILPFLVTLAVFWFIPVARSFVMSTQEVLYGQTTSVGMDNYARLWNDSVFWTAMRNSARYMVLTLLLLIPIPMMLAAVVSSRIGSRRVKAFFKASMFVPALTSVVVSGLVFRLMFSESDSALMNQVVQFFGFGPVRWLREDLTGLAALLALAVWRWTGVNTMYFIAGMQSIPAEYYEAAAIDGANKRQQFLRITVPNLRPTIVYVTTISVYGGLAMFLESFMLYGGNASPNNQALTVVGYLYRKGIEQNDLGFASAVGIVLLVVVMTINITQLTLSGTFRKENVR